MYARGRRLDEVKQVSVVFIEDWSTVVCDWPTPTPAAHVYTTGRRRHGRPCDVSLWSGYFIDADLVIRTHVHATNCIAVFRRTLTNCIAVSRRTLTAATHSSRGAASHSPDAGGDSRSVSTGLRQWRADSPPAYLLRRLPVSAQCVSTVDLSSIHRSDHLTDALASLQWLGAPERIQFKMAVLTYKVLHGTAPRYLACGWLTWSTWSPFSWH